MIPNILSYFVDEGTSLFGQITTAVTTFTTNIQTVLTTFFTWLQGEQERLVTGIMQYFTGEASVFGQIMSTSTEFVSNMKTQLGEFFTWIQDETGKLLTDGVLEKTRRFLEDLVKLVSQKLMTDSDSIKQTVTQFFTNITELVDQKLLTDSDSIKETTTQFFDDMTKLVKDSLTDGSDNIMKTNEDFFKDLLELVDKSYHDGDKALQPATEDLIDWMKDYLQSNLDEIYSIVEDHLKKVKQKVNNICNKIEDKITGVVGEAYNWGSELGANFADGIWSQVGAVAAAAAELAAAAGDYIHFSEPDKGPLSNFHTFMPDMIDMMTKGIKAGIPEVESAMKGLSGSLIPEYGSYTPTGQAAGTNNITINVYGAGDDEALAQMVLDKINHMVYMQGAA